MKDDYIGTYTGGKFFFNDPKPDQINIEDIARALSNQCRYAGHVRRFYSVAEHSVHVMKLRSESTSDPRVLLGALLHDASEAYLCDIPRPIKPFLSNYFDMEKKIEHAIQDRFVCPAMDVKTNYIDHHIVGAEARVLFKVVPDWVSQYDYSIELDMYIGHPPEQARSMFLNAFRELTR